MYYPRRLYPKLLAHAQTPLVTVITGMRRTGKTTLVNQLLKDLPNPNSLFLDLQRADIRELFRLPNYDAIRLAIIQRGLHPDRPMIVALDEIQLAPQIPEVVKYLYDHYQIKFIVTGSSSYYLKNLFTESLAGRKKVFELFPLNFNEYLTFKGESLPETDWLNHNFNPDLYHRFHRHYEDFIRWGGFPQVTLAETPAEKQDLLSDILSSYLNLDVKSLADFADERNLLNLAQLLTKRIGSRLDISRLANETGLSRPTIANYLTFFEKTYLIATLPVFSLSIDRQIVKARKIYFVDTGLANTLGAISSGAQFENTIHHQLSLQKPLTYFSLKSGQEIDFVYDGRFALEVKETPLLQDQKSLSQISLIAKLEQHRLIGRYPSPKFNQYIWGGAIG